MENTFWSDGYFACSVGNASADTIENIFKSKLSLSIHPRDFRYARITGFSRQIR
ncbi:hypothetical protein [Shewanella psychromarinicola]|uniref:hypothetical protein n=1 Tax=Shewanella psychromarinicola TaxID=2487742 RepID=UPI00355887C5